MSLVDTIATPDFGLSPNPDLPEEISPASSLSDLPEKFTEQCEECGKVVEAKSAIGARILLGRHRGKEHPGSSPPPSVPRETSPTKVPRGTSTQRTKRQSGADLLSMAADGVGSLMAMTGIPSSPAGMALKLEASLIGPAADKAVADTFIDKSIIQPVIKAKGKFDEIGPLVMFPVLIGLADKSPMMRPQLYPLLRMCITPMLSQLVASMKRAQSDQATVRKAAADLAAMDPGFAQMFEGDVDPIDAILATLFPPMEEAPVSGDEATDIAAGG